MAKTRSYDIAIAGSGFAGTTLALALSAFAPKGFRIALVDAERPDRQKADARASGLSAASKRLLSALGAWPELKAQAQPITSIEITDSALNAAVRPQLLGFNNEGETGEAEAFMVENADLTAALADAVGKALAIDILAPESVSDHTPGAVGVAVELGGSGTIEAPLLVAADGKRSQIRERAGIKCIAWSYPQIGIVATVAHSRPHGGKAVQHFLPGGPFAILPLTGNRSSIVWTEEARMGAEIMESGDDRFLAELSKRFGAQLGDISVAGPRQSFPLEFQIARSFIARRVALIGDAAHAVHPLAGQGLNIGLRDVAALTEIIVEGVRLGLDIGSATLLERYQRWRRFDSAFSAGVMDGMNRLFSNDSAPLRLLRELGLGAVDASPWIKSVIVREAAGSAGAVPRLLKGEMI
jgi:2-octaprenyl-6-methoxyphenol hydroxylase